MNGDLKNAIELYMNSINHISNENNEMKEVRLRQKKCKEQITTYMKTNNMKFIDMQNGMYLVLKQKHIKPQLNEEFLSYAFKEFYNNHNREKSDIHTVSKEFGLYVISLQKHMSSTTDVLQMTRKRPIASILMEDFKIQ